MNYIKNDYGVSVVAVGAPNSLARVRATYPKLISEIKELLSTKDLPKPEQEMIIYLASQE